MMECKVVDEFQTPAGNVIQMKICTTIPENQPKKEMKAKPPQRKRENQVEVHGGIEHRNGILMVNGLNRKFNGCDCQTPPTIEVNTPFKRHRLDLKCPTNQGDVLVEIETLKSFKEDHSLSQFLAADVEVIANRFVMCGIARTSKGQEFLKQTQIPACPQILRNRLISRLENFRKNCGVYGS